MCMLICMNTDNHAHTRTHARTRTPADIYIYICVWFPLSLECATHAADIVFLLDSSDSISDDNWVKMLHFVSSVVGQLQVNVILDYSLFNFTL